MDIKLIESMKNPYYLQKFSEISYSLNDVYRLYEYYLNNLKEIVKLNKSLFSFTTISDININEQILQSRFADSDIFLNDVSLISFGRELEKHGTYWTFITCGGSLKEGVHRAMALKSINSNKKFLCWNFINNQLETSIDLYILFPSSNVKNMNSLNFVEENVYLVSVNSYEEIYELMVTFSMFLSRIIIQYRQNFIPSDIINSQIAFNKWRDLL